MSKEWLEVRYNHLLNTINTLLETYSNKISAYNELDEFSDVIALNYVQDKSLLKHFTSMQEDLNILSEVIEKGIDETKEDE